MLDLNNENFLKTERLRINYLLVDDHKALLIIRTHFILQLDYLQHSIFNELPLSLHQLVSLVCALVEEPRVHFSVKTDGEYDYRLTNS